MLDFLYKYRRDVHSQNGEDGILAEIVHRIGPGRPGYCVEIGGHDGHWMSNTRLLIEFGWHGLFVEANYDLYLQCKSNWANFPNVRCQCSHVDGRNVNAFVKGGCDLLSLDTDGGDYEIFSGLVVRPKIVIVEIDSSIPPDSDSFNSDGGAGYKPMVSLALNRGYFLLAHTGNQKLSARKLRHCRAVVAHVKARMIGVVIIPEPDMHAYIIVQRQFVLHGKKPPYLIQAVLKIAQRLKVSREIPVARRESYIMITPFDCMVSEFDTIRD